jgi:hypothetical protein
LKKTAFSILPDRLQDKRHEKILAGLRRHGYEIRRGFGKPQSQKDVLVTWTVFRGSKWQMAQDFEAAGARVIVAEEAYFRQVNGEKHFALALHDHNGAGQWHRGGPERWQSFNIDLRPWRKDGEFVLVREQRGIASPAMASPLDWHEHTARKLKAITKRPVKIRWHHKSRAHPEKAAAQQSMAEALANAWAVCTWNSAMACEALVAGVPVFLGAPHCIVEDACNRDFSRIDNPEYPERLPAFHDLAWAQWSASEIQSGKAFETLLEARI